MERRLATSEGVAHGSFNFIYFIPTSCSSVSNFIPAESSLFLSHSISLPSTFIDYLGNIEEGVNFVADSFLLLPTIDLVQILNSS